jgi:hypothetical protein
MRNINFYAPRRAKRERHHPFRGETITPKQARRQFQPDVSISVYVLLQNDHGEHSSSLHELGQ